MTDYSDRFRTANIQQLQQVCAQNCAVLRVLLDKLCGEGANAVANFDRAIAAILSTSADTDEKPDAWRTLRINSLWRCTFPNASPEDGGVRKVDYVDSRIVHTCLAGDPLVGAYWAHSDFFAWHEPVEIDEKPLLDRMEAWPDGHPWQFHNGSPHWVRVRATGLIGRICDSDRHDGMLVFALDAGPQDQWFRISELQQWHEPIEADEKPLPPVATCKPDLQVQPDRVVRSGDLVVGRRYRDTLSKAVFVCVREGRALELGEIRSKHSAWGWLIVDETDAVRYVTAVELVEDEAEQPDRAELCTCLKPDTGPSKTWCYACSRKVDPTIIHAAEGVVLKPGEYEGAAGGAHRFALTERLQATRCHGRWVFNYSDDQSCTAVRRVEPQAPKESSPAGSALVNGEPGFINYCSLCRWMGFNSACPNCKGDRGLRLYVRAKDEPAQPAGEAQPETKCARCGGSGDAYYGRDACPDCKGTGKARVEAPDLRLFHATTELEAVSKEAREHADARAQLLAENASLRERLEAAERDKSSAEWHNKQLRETLVREEKAFSELAQSQKKAEARAEAAERLHQLWRDKAERHAAERMKERERAEQAEREHERTLVRRDELEDKLDAFVLLAGGEEECGEHSSDNDPWRRAYEHMETIVKRVGQAERECAELKRLNEALEAQAEADMAVCKQVRDEALQLERELTEKLASYEREAKAWKAIDRWLSKDAARLVTMAIDAKDALLVFDAPERYAYSFRDASKRKALCDAAAWCESQLKKESEASDEKPGR